MGAAQLPQGDDTEHAYDQERPQCGCHVTGRGQDGPEVADESAQQRGEGGVPAGTHPLGVVDLDVPGCHAQLVDEGHGCRGDAVRRFPSRWR